MSEEINYDVEIDGNAAPERLRTLVQHVDEIAEIPNSLRDGTPVHLDSIQADPRRSRRPRESAWGPNNVGYGRYWARTSDLRLVETALSQLS